MNRPHDSHISTPCTTVKSTDSPVELPPADVELELPPADVELELPPAEGSLIDNYPRP